MQDIYGYYQKMHHDNVVLAYKGTVSEELFDSILRLAESKLNKLELKSSLKKKVFNILVEILQNIYHHFGCGEREGAKESIVFLLYKDTVGYRIISGNPMKRQDAQRLKERLDTLNGMTHEELRAVYRDRLSRGKPTDKGGAGLGMMDILRKSGERIGYNFQDIDNDLSFFSLEIKISA